MSAVPAAVVGAGLMGSWHARELRRAGGRLVAVADLDGAAARALAARHPGARAHESAEALLASCEPQVVHVCTPAQSHGAIGEQVLAAGAHLLMEKPLAPTVAGTERLVAAAEAAGRLACPVHQYLFQAPLRPIEGLLERVGRPVEIATLACSAGAAGRPAADAAAVAADILPHPLAAAHRLLEGGVGDLRFAAAAPRPGELRALAAAGDVGVSIAVSMAGRPTCNELRLTGEDGTVHVDFFHGFAFAEGGGVSRARKVVRPLGVGAAMSAAATGNLARRALRRQPAYPGLRELIAAMYAFVDGRGPAPIEHDETLSVARAREAVLSAAADRA